MAEGLAGVSAGALLLYNFTALEQNVVRFDRETDVVYAMILDRFGEVVAHSRAPGAVGSTPSDAVSLRALVGRARCSRRRPGRTGRRSTTSRCRSWSRASAGAPCASGSRASAWTRRSPAPGGSWPALAVVALVLGGLATAHRRAAHHPAGPPARRRRRRDRARGAGPAHRAPAAPTSSAGWRSRSTRWPRSCGSSGRTSRSADAALRQRFAELSDLKSYTDHILRSFVNGLVTLDLDGRVVTVNPAAEILTGCTASALTGRPATEVFHHVPELRDLLLETLRTRVGVPQVCSCCPRSDRAADPGRGDDDAPPRGGGPVARRGGHPPRPDARPPAGGAAAALRPSRRAGHAGGRAGPRDQESAHVHHDVQPARRPAIRRRAVPPAVPERRPP